MVASNGMGGMLGSYISAGRWTSAARSPVGRANLMLLCCIAGRGVGCARAAGAEVNGKK